MDLLQRPIHSSRGQTDHYLVWPFVGVRFVEPWGGGLNRKSVTDILWRILLSDDGLRHAARLKRKEVDFCSGEKWSFSLELIFGGLLRSVFAVTPETAQQVLYFSCAHFGARTLEVVTFSRISPQLPISHCDRQKGARTSAASAPYEETNTWMLREGSCPGSTKNGVETLCFLGLLNVP